MKRSILACIGALQSGPGTMQFAAAILRYYTDRAVPLFTPYR